jgi:hypothetical protein
MKTLFALGAAAALLAGCASDYPQNAAYAGRAGSDAVDTVGGCFRIMDIRAHRIADPRTLYIDVGGRETYRLEMSGSCMSGASRQETLITESRTGGLICRPIDFDLKVKMSGGFPTSCIIQNMTRLTPSEVAALPPELRP